MRAPYQVLIIPYCKINQVYHFAVFERADMDCWQWIAGGGEDFDADILAAAKREWLIALIRDSGGNVVELTLDDTAEVEIEEQLAGYSGRQ